MKPPLTVEAKVAEELRNWLASELEQLDASNTNQFAHHVVTILLHEDLDIEDEPLSTGDDFLQDIYSINRRKTRDRQKKAAVQFLRSAVCCNESDEAEIQGVVDELMVKIDETKNRMNNKTSKRSLLAPIAINVKTAATQTCSKSDGSEEERLYNEAFPSLAAEESPNKEGLARLSNYSVWNRSSPMGKENSKKKMRRKLCQYAHRQSYMFSCQEEAQACSIAREVAALALAETSLPNAEATEVFPSTLYDSSPSSYSDSSGCWKSAFRTVIFTKVFIPSTTPIQQNRPTSSNPISKVFSPKIIQGICGSLFTISDPSFDFLHTFSDEDIPLKKFHPVHDETTEHLFPQEDHCHNSGETRFADIEVCKIFTASSHRQEELRSKVQKLNKKAKTKVDTPYQKQKDSELDGALQFPYHCGDFWQELVYKGAVALYPDLNRRDKVGSETDGETLMLSRSDTGLASKISVLVTPRAVKDLSLLCLEAIGNYFTPETMKKFVVKYISNVESGCEIRIKPRNLVKCIVDTLLERKEKALLLSRCNITDHRIQEKIYIDQLLHICMATMNDFFPFGPDNMVWSAENMAFVEDAASESMYSNPVLPQEEYWKAVDSESYISGLGYNDVDKMNLADGPLKCSSGQLPSSYGDYVAFSCTDEMLESNSGSLDMSDGLFAEDVMYFSEEVGPPSVSGFSPSFLDKIDLRYLDDLDARSLENDQTGHLKAALSFKEKILLWRNNVQPAYFIEKWPVACEGFGDEDSWLGQKNSKTENFNPLSPGYHLTAAMQTADIETYDQQDMGIFSSDQEQLHWENPWSHTKWDSICQEVLTDIMFGCTSWGNHTSPPNPFMPSLLTSCLSTEGAQFLQSAFVNSYFSSNFSGPATPLKESSIAVDCSALEKLWLTKEKQKKSPELEQLWLTKEMQQSFAFGFNSAQYELIRGCTCSNWLENNCKLGLLCPFSHPSI